MLNTKTFLEDKPLDFQQKIPLYGSNQYNLKLSPPANEKKRIVSILISVIGNAFGDG